MNSRLSGPSQHQLQVSGQFSATLTYGTTVAQDVIFQRSLLGRPGIEKLNLVSRVNVLEDTTTKFITMFPQLFTGLGTVPGVVSEMELNLL